MIWILGGYMWLFIHRPFEIWPALGDMQLERIYMIATLACWAIAVDKRWISNRLNAGLLALAAVILFSDLLSPFGANVTRFAQDWFKVLVFYGLVISTVRSERDLKRLVVMFIVVMAIYMGHSLREYLNGRHFYRMGTVRMLGVDQSYSDPNTFSATILYSLPLLWPLWKLSVRPWQRLLLAGYFGLAASCILLTGSRSGFVGLACLVLVGAWLCRVRFSVILLLFVAVPLVWSSLRGDLQNRFLTLIDPSRGPANAEESAEGRIQGWHDGVRFWTQHPLLGVGAGNFARARGYDLEAHHLYGQVLGELGTLGAIAFAMLVWAFAANWRECGRLGRIQAGGHPACRVGDTFPARLISAVTFTVPVLLLMGFSGHNLYRYTWVWYGAFQAVALQCLRRVGRVRRIANPSYNTLFSHDAALQPQECGV